MNRRQLLATVATSTSVLAGCSSTTGDETTRIATDSEVREHPSADRPPVVSFALTNVSDEPITVSANEMKPFVYFPRLTGESGALVLIPGNDPHVYADVASTPTDGCWRFADDEGEETYVVTNSIADRITLEPDQVHRVNQQLYYEGEEDDCFQDGDYSSEHTVEFHEAEETVEFAVRVTVSDKRISSLEVTR